MDKVIVLAYDLGAVLIILMTMARSAQKGFATGIFQLVGRLAAFFGALFVAREGASIIYDSFLKTEVTSFLNRNLQGGQAAEIISQLQAGLDQLPQVLGNVLDMALDVDAITQAVSQGTSSLASVLEEAVIGPAVLGFVSVLLFTVCFALLGGLVRLLTSAIHFVFHSPILLPIDRFLGIWSAFCSALSFISLAACVTAISRSSWTPLSSANFTLSTRFHFLRKEKKTIEKAPSHLGKGLSADLECIV